MTVQIFGLFCVSSERECESEDRGCFVLGSGMRTSSVLLARPKVMIRTEWGFGFVVVRALQNQVVYT